MKRILLFCVIGLILTFSLSSCGSSREAASNYNLNQTSVVLEKNNFKVLGTVQGESKQTYVFGIGGLSARSLGQSAMSEMLKKGDTEGKARAIINVTVQYKTQSYFFWWKKKAIATGTVIEFID